MNNHSIYATTFYTEQGPFSNAGSYTPHLDALPTDLPGLVKAVQGLMLHLHWATRYDVDLTHERKEEANLRTIRERLAKLLELDHTSIASPRHLSKKSVGTCRDFTLLLTAFLRHQNKPARARVGFGTYFTPGIYEDHWVCEYWHDAETRWVMVDPQLDDFQIENLAIDFDPFNMPREKFVTGPQAWLRCRADLADPNLFGIFDMRGLDFIKGNLVRDFLALNKIEVLPWDVFLLIEKPLVHMNADEKALMDRLAHLSTGDDRDFIPLRTAFTANQQQLLPNAFLKQLTQ